MLVTYAVIVTMALTLLIGRHTRFGGWLQKYLGVSFNDSDGRGFYDRLRLSDELDIDELEDEDDENLIDPDHTPRQYWLNSRLQNWFYYQGLFCARYPWFVIMTSLGFVALCSLGWSRFSVERNPVNLWVSPGSTALAQKNHFEENFTPFYRTSQLFFVSETDEPIASCKTCVSILTMTFVLYRLSQVIGRVIFPISTLLPGRKIWISVQVNPLTACLNISNH